MNNASFVSSSYLPVLQAHGIVKRFDEAGRSLDILKGVDLDVFPSDTIAITGVSGSGKSTLLHILGGLEPATSGHIAVAGDPLPLKGKAQSQWRNRYLGFVYQFHHLLPELTAQENVALPLWIRRSSTSDALSKAQTLLNALGLSHRAEHRPDQLSGGERQRVAIARALVTEPRCLLADEPTGNLDAANADQVWQLMMEWAKNIGTALIVVTHDERLSLQCQKKYRLEQGRLVKLA